MRFSTLKSGRILLYLAACCSTFGVLAAIKTLAPQGPGLPTQTWPAGTLLAELTKGGRVGTWHRGYLYYKSSVGSMIYDISDPTSPQILQEDPTGGSNGHAWWKIGDMLLMEYHNPELDGTNYRFMDFSDPEIRGPWTDTSVMPVDMSRPENRELATFPHAFTSWNNHIIDIRTSNFTQLGTYNFPGSVGAGYLTNTMRVGNILLGQPDGMGLAAWDVGDPTNVRLLDHLNTGHQQYSDGKMVWRNHLVMMIGDDSNPGGVN
ncbi:MAG: hypothetical protein AAFV07_18100, partial [Bacteroidota bacterium]